MTTTELPACCPPPGDPALDEDGAVELAAMFKVLADPVRLRLLSIVTAAEAGEVCACDLPDVVGRSQPTVSHHLAQLVEAVLVTREQRGRWAWFAPVPSRLAELAAALA